jgi:hypothetical protein
MLYVRGFFTAAALATVAGCTTPNAWISPDRRAPHQGTGGGVATATDPTAPDPLAAPDVHTTPLGHVDLAPPPAPVPPDPRELRRMDIDQIDAAIERATGRRWVDDEGLPLFAEFASTLGKPNFINAVNEDLSVSLMFEKFLGDAARSTCADAIADEEPALFERVDRDAAWTVANQPAIQANVRDWVLRFHGRAYPEGAPELEPWNWLVQSTMFRTNDPKKGWRALCVGLITHPDFIAY